MAIDKTEAAERLVVAAIGNLKLKRFHFSESDWKKEC